MERCDMCELLACAYVTGAEQSLQAGMWVDRLLRFGDPAAVEAAVAKAIAIQEQSAVAWSNLTEHRRESHADSTSA